MIKVYFNEHPPWSEICVADAVHSWSFSLKCYAYLRLEKPLYWRYNFFRRIITECSCACFVHHAHSALLPFSVLCAVKTWSSKVGSSVVCYCLSNYLLLPDLRSFSHYKHTWVLFNATNTGKSTHVPLLVKVPFSVLHNVVTLSWDYGIKLEPRCS